MNSELTQLLKDIWTVNKNRTTIFANWSAKDDDPAIIELLQLGYIYAGVSPYPGYSAFDVTQRGMDYLETQGR